MGSEMCIRDSASGAAGVYNISKSRLLAFPAPLVSSERQKAYGIQLAAHDREGARAMESLAAGEALFASLQSRAFRGEL